MVQVVMGGTQDYNALVYGMKHPGTMQYLENQVANISQNLTEAGRSFYANARQLYEQINGSEALRMARAAIRMAGNVFQQDCIMSIWELAQLQNAPLTMQRWIMANPVVREVYHEQRCDGYSDTYVDMSPKDIGVNHYDYRRVMNGVVVDDEETGGWKSTIWIDDLIEGDRELEIEERDQILNTWEMVSAIMQLGDRDPTSASGGKL